MSVGRGIAVANVESVKHGIDKDSWIVARGVRTTVKSSSGNRVMHECFVFGPDHEELAKNFALKLFGEGEGSPPSEVSLEMMRSVKRHSKSVSLASKSMDKFCKEWREIVSAPVLSGAESTEPDDSEVSLPSPTHQAARSSAAGANLDITKHARSGASFALVTVVRSANATAMSSAST